MNIEGFWTVVFHGLSGTNGGVVMLLDGKICGGDSNFFYSGEYKESDGKLEALVNATHYHGPRATALGTNADHFVLTLQGALTADGLIEGSASGDGGPIIPFKATRRA